MFRFDRFALGILLLTTLLAATAASAVSPVNTTLLGVAVKGYDVVAYHTDGAAVPGSKQHVFEWKGATWRFASSEHRDLFASDPERYAPRYGGYCAYAVSQGTTADVDPTAWRIVDGRLYLNLDARIQKRWEKDIPGHIAAADANWPGLVGE